jgi:PAS domain S-box-containing protein
MFYFHLVLEQGTVFTHFFYIPIILASLWWKRKGLVVAIFLAAILIVSHIFIRLDMETTNDYLRALMFIVIAFVVATLSEQIAKANRATKIAHAELNQIFNTAADAMRVIDKDFNMLRINQTFLTLSGMSKDEASGKKCYEVLSNNLCHTPDCPLTRILGGEEHVECEVEIECTDGIKIPCILTVNPFKGVGGELIGIIEDFKDITERKQAEEVLRRASTYNRSLIEASLDPLVTIDPEGKITDVNTDTEVITGCSREELIGTDFSDYFTEPEKARAGYQQVFQEGVVQDYALEIRHRDGHVTPVLYNASVYRDEAGNVIGVFAAARDITERRQAEEELARSNAELQSANKELETFSYSVSHDLRAPLRSVDGFSQILLEDYSDALDEQGKHYLQRARASTQKMGQLIDDILNLSRIGRQPMKKKKINMVSITREVYNSLEDEWKGRKVDFNVHKCPPAAADLNLIQIVFMNLLSNALKFARKREEAKIEVGSETKDEQTVFFVKDNGVGFDMKYADKLFTPFQRLHRVEEYEGTGIGLAIVQRIIHRHGGRIWVESKVGKGTTFYFTLTA